MDSPLTELENVLVREISAHEALAGLLEKKLAAVRESRSGDVELLLGRENEQLQHLAELAKRRIELVGALAERLVPEGSVPSMHIKQEEGKPPLRLGELAEHLPEPQRTRVQELRQRLADRMQQVRTRTGTLRRASQSLLQHMHGVMQTVAGALSVGGMYSRRGQPPAGSLSVSTFSATG